MNQLIAAVTSLVLAGCSFVFVRGPDKSAPRTVYPECTGGKALPIVDAIIAGVYAAAGLTAIGRADDPVSAPGVMVEDSKLSPRAAAALSAGLAAGFGASAVYGFYKVKRCRAEREVFQATYPQGVPGAYPGPYPPYAGQPGYPPPQGVPPPGPGQPLPPGWVPTPMPAGYEGGACLANHACAQGLVCASNLCTRPPQAAR